MEQFIQELQKNTFELDVMLSNVSDVRKHNLCQLAIKLSNQISTTYSTNSSISETDVLILISLVNIAKSIVVREISEEKFQFLSGIFMQLHNTIKYGKTDQKNNELNSTGVKEFNRNSFANIVLSENFSLSALIDCIKTKASKLKTLINNVNNGVTSCASYREGMLDSVNEFLAENRELIKSAFASASEIINPQPIVDVTKIYDEATQKENAKKILMDFILLEEKYAEKVMKKSHLKR